MNPWSEIAGFARFAAGIPGFFRRRASGDPAEWLARRTDSFLRIMRLAVYGREDSPYRKLLSHAGIGEEDLRGMVCEHGLEGALVRLHEAGVHVTLDEFKGRKPVRRGSLTIETGEGSFDNPLLLRHYAASTGGSGGRPRRLRIDLDLLSREARYAELVLLNYGLVGRPFALWRPAPLASAGLKSALRMASIGQRPERWFSQTEVRGWKPWLLLVGSQGGVRYPLARACASERRDGGRAVVGRAERRWRARLSGYHGERCCAGVCRG